MNTNTAEQYPVPDSVKNERIRILNIVANLEKQLVDVNRKSDLGYDPSYSRTAAKLQKRIAGTKQRVAVYDKKIARLIAAQTSDASKAARIACYDAATIFESRLAAFVQSAEAVKTTAAVLAASLMIADAGMPLSTQMVGSGIKLQGFGSNAKPPLALNTLFESHGES